MPDAEVLVFIDSNTFLYSVDEREQEKRPQAQDWIEALSDTDAGVANLQVFNEVTNVFLRRMRHLTPERLFEIVDSFADFGTQPISNAEVAQARDIHRRYRYSWWDCLLLASAVNLGCTHFLSEDLNDGQNIEGLTIVSPFAHTPHQILLSR